MGPAWFTFQELFAQFSGLARKLVRPAQRTGSRTAAARWHHPTALHMQAGRGHVAWTPAGRPAVMRQPLRVLRVVDACHAPSSAGRMVISGRMADVCAELDRLVALETARP